jgi:hypothetical protein
LTQTFTGAKTQVAFATESFDRDDNYASDAFTAPVTGDYEFEARLSNASGVTSADIWFLSIERSGGSSDVTRTSVYVPANAAGAAAIAVRAKYALTAGDEVKVYMTRSAGSGNYVVVDDASFNHFMGKRVA